MTGLPADVFGVQGRGRIAEGLAADLVIFDSDRIADEATFESPRAYPRGNRIRDGEWNMGGRGRKDDGRDTGGRAGKKDGRIEMERSLVRERILG